MSSNNMDALTNRAIRNIVSELEFLADTNVISTTTLHSIMKQLPTAKSTLMANAAFSPPTPAPGPVPHTSTPAIPHPTFSPPPSTKTPFSEKYLPIAAQAPPPPPPSYTPTALPTVHVLSLANAQWAFAGTEKGDLTFNAGDTIEVLEKVKEDWWKGRVAGGNGEIGLFPSSYVQETRVLAGPEKPALPNLPPRTGSGYGSGGNMMTDVAHGSGSAPSQQQQEERKGIVGKNGEKFGKKLGNAAIFGAGATIGGKIVNGIF
ncbi:SH3-domain-containing protein [Choiromyces venosus 120613-1]|uniref:SH3-domain-containing protein n=1 Tax=Choiromyces venosus 120613-1 TaxID=1336337 RepID=A0A3N4JHQ6_9PEZI|nr:SH3-domain-containing protein [Choiromyces venosus 120613-1]